jgi:nucleoside recognition membrane protein YjiH
MLKHRGHPFLLAQRFPTKQYLLIGPALLPFYWQTLKAALALAFLVVPSLPPGRRRRSAVVRRKEMRLGTADYTDHAEAP